MFSDRPVRSLSSRLALPFVLGLLLVLLQPCAANAMTLSAPANVLDRVDVKASLTASDTAGLAMLYLDGNMVRSVATTSGTRSLSFTGIPLAAGSHRVRLLVRSAKGIAGSAPRDIVSWRKPTPPAMVSPSGRYCARNVTIVARAGLSTTSLKLTLNGRVIATKAVSPGQLVTMAKVSLASGANTVVLQGSNPAAFASATFSLRRLDFPWPTCIVVDKSEFRLYWVRDGVLVKTYPVAIGKPSTPTPVHNWRIDEKYVYDFWGVYGPRRMRLYKQVGTDSFSYTNYGIHGTNEEWVIGTMASHGCIRMYNKDVLELYPQVPLYTMVQTRD
jgi:lipoprotein-anchoring transpeptidase ErfK/SrfK